MHWAKEDILGNRKLQSNVFRWEQVRLNLPGTHEYNPARPWVYKERGSGEVAADINVYVANLCPTGPTEDDCWQASQRMSSTLARLGLQDAARKRRPPSQSPGSWAGANVDTTEGRVWITVSQTKWEKLQRQVCRLDEMMKKDKNWLPHKELLFIQGYIMYIVRAFPALNVYMKGLHGTIDSWRPNRDLEGWKIVSKKQRKRDQLGVAVAQGAQNEQWEALWERMMDKEDDFETIHQDQGDMKPPEVVRAVSRFLYDVQALIQMTAGEKPPKRLARPTDIAIIRYGFGEASGTGYGSSLWTPGKGIVYRSGLWGWTINQELFSNFRELANLVHAVEDASSQGLLQNTEIWLITDNLTAEAAFFNGTSSSRALFELVLWLRRLELGSGGRIFVIHVSGRRMIWQGTDALSRGDRLGGVMSGVKFVDFVPTHRTALERSEELRGWIEDLEEGLRKEGTELVRLDPTGWLDTRWKSRVVYLWDLAPSAAGTALEYLAKTILKRPWTTHIIIVPCVMTAWWRRLLSKCTDFVFTAKLGSFCWSTSMFEPLTFALYLPLSKVRPWQHRYIPNSIQYAWALQELWQVSGKMFRDLLLKLLYSAWDVASL